MNEEQALNLIKQIANQLFENGSITVSPKGHTALTQAIKVLEASSEKVKKSTKKAEDKK